jgi:hypothetical protein
MRRGTLFGNAGGTGLPVTRRGGGGRGGSNRIRPTFFTLLALLAVSLASTVFLYFWCGMTHSSDPEMGTTVRSRVQFGR